MVLASLIPWFSAILICLMVDLFPRRPVSKWNRPFLSFLGVFFDRSTISKDAIPTKNLARDSIPVSVILLQLAYNSLILRFLEFASNASRNKAQLASETPQLVMFKICKLPVSARNSLHDLIPSSSNELPQRFSTYIDYVGAVASHAWIPWQRSDLAWY